MKELTQALENFETRIRSYFEENSKRFEDQIIATFYPELISPIPMSLLIKLKPTDTIIPQNTEIILDQYRFSVCRDHQIYDNNVKASIVYNVNNLSHNFPRYLKLEFSEDFTNIELYISDNKLFGEMIGKTIYSEDGSYIGSIDFLNNYGNFTNFATQYSYLYEYKLCPQKYHFIKCKLTKSAKIVFIGLTSNVKINQFSVQLNVIPVLNLYQAKSDVIYFDKNRIEYDIKSTNKIFTIQGVHAYDFNKSTQLTNGIDYCLYNYSKISFRTNHSNKAVYADLLCLDEITSFGSKAEIDGFNHLTCEVIHSYIAEQFNDIYTIVSLSSKYEDKIAILKNIYNIAMPVQITSSKTYEITNPLIAWKTCVPKMLYIIECDMYEVPAAYALAKCILRGAGLDSINEVNIKTNHKILRITG